jgi:hypothetical protein
VAVGSESSATAKLAAGDYYYTADYNPKSNTNYAAVVGTVKEKLHIDPAKISGYKWDDANPDGMWDINPLTSKLETGVPGVTIQLYKETNGKAGLQTGIGGDTLVATATTGTNGAYSFNVASLGTYYIKEVVPTGWVLTTSSPVTVTETGADVVGRFGYTDPTNFGDTQITNGTGNAGTMGFWHNTNGELVLTGSKTATQLLAKYQALFTTAAGTVVPNTNGALGLANPNKAGYTVLVDGSGNYIAQSSFTGSKGFTYLANYLTNSSATNMAYMLGAQMLATEFNIAAGYVNATQFIYIPNVGGMNSGDLNALHSPPSGLTAVTGNFVQISTVVTDALQALIKYSYVPSGHVARNYDEALMNMFVSINQNGNIFGS